MNKAMGRREIKPRDAPQMAALFLGTAVTAGTTTHLMSLVMELFHPLKHMGVTQLTGMVAQLAGFGPIAQATFGQVFFETARWPMRYHVQGIYRTQLPGPGDLAKMMTTGQISHRQWRTALAMHSWSDNWMDVVNETLWDRPSAFALSWTTEGSTLDPTWVYEMMRFGGMKAEDAKKMMNAIVQKGAAGIRDKFTAAVLNLYGEGARTKTEATAELLAADMRQDQVDLQLREKDLQFDLMMVKDLVAMFRARVRDGSLSIPDFELGLVQLGLDSPRVRWESMRATIDLAPRIARKERKETELVIRKVQGTYSKLYRDQFMNALIGPDRYFSQLVGLGIDPVVAEGTVARDTLRVTKGDKMLPALAARVLVQDIFGRRATEFTKLATAGVITPLVMGGQLSRLGLPQRQVQELVRIAEFDTIRAREWDLGFPIEASAEFLAGFIPREQALDFKRGRITEAAFRRSRVPFGLSEAQIAREISDLLLGQPLPSPSPTPFLPDPAPPGSALPPFEAIPTIPPPAEFIEV